VSERCDRFERERLADLLDEPLDGRDGEAGFAAHVDSCNDCRATRERYERIARALADLGTGAERRSDHVARVLATAAAETVARRRARRLAKWTAPALALAAAVALVWWLRGPEPAPPRFALEIVARGQRTLRGDAHLGDRLRATARRGEAIWIYRNGRELLRVCPRDCDANGDRVVVELELDAIGRYQVVWLSNDRVTLPAGDVERDVAAARASGAVHELRDIEVQ
jgi:hypothetical protein